MRDWSLKHLGNGALLRDLQTLAAQDCVQLAKVLAHIAEVDARGLFREAGYNRMWAYLVGALHFSEGAASKRLQAARAAREFLVIFEAVAQGRIHLSGIVVLRPKLTAKNVEGLLDAATHKTREDIEKLLVARSPKPDMPQRVRAISPASLSSCGGAPASAAGQPRAVTEPAVAAIATGAPAQELAHSPFEIDSSNPLPSETLLGSLSPGTPQSETLHSKVTPLSPEKYGIQLTIQAHTYELLLRAQNLLAFQVPPKDFAPVLHRALELLVRDLERRKFAATDKPRRSKQPSSPHTIPAHVKREVWERDQGQCTFVNEDGRRCPGRSGIEFDHLRPKGRASLDGGTTAITASDVRLLCKAHNQLAAERIYGAAFMQNKREQAATARTAVT